MTKKLRTRRGIGGGGGELLRNARCMDPQRTSNRSKTRSSDEGIISMGQAKRGKKTDEPSVGHDSDKTSQSKKRSSRGHRAPLGDKALLAVDCTPGSRGCGVCCNSWDVKRREAEGGVQGGEILRVRGSMETD